MKFTEDWFSNNIDNFKQCMAAAPERKRFLEIGVFEGRSTCWLLENGLDAHGEITCIDPFDFWPGIHTQLSGAEAMAHFMENHREVCLGTQRVHLLQDYSYSALARLIVDGAKFDFIYVDGSHDPHNVLQDACMAWGLLSEGGVMLFDDYRYPHKNTRMGIDGFLNAFEGHYDTIINNYQYGIKKCVR